MDKRCIGVTTRVIIHICLMIGILVLAGCARQSYVFPPPMALKKVLLSVTIDQISNNYKNDPVAVDGKYLGKKLLLDKVVVFTIHTTYCQAGPGQMFSLTLDYFTSKV